MAAAIQAHFGLPVEISTIIEKARASWLKNDEVYTLLNASESLGLAVQNSPPTLPAGGNLFLFSRKQCRNFRKDGHNWRTKTDGKTVRETHEKLKVGNIEALNCYYAHADQDDCLQRRSYWRLAPDEQDLVLVHYLCTEVTRVNGGLGVRAAINARGESAALNRPRRNIRGRSNKIASFTSSEFSFDDEDFSEDQIPANFMEFQVPQRALPVRQARTTHYVDLNSSAELPSDESTPVTRVFSGRPLGTQGITLPGAGMVTMSSPLESNTNPLTHMISDPNVFRTVSLGIQNPMLNSVNLGPFHEDSRQFPRLASDSMAPGVFSQTSGLSKLMTEWQQQESFTLDLPPSLTSLTSLELPETNGSMDLAALITATKETNTTTSAGAEPLKNRDSGASNVHNSSEKSSIATHQLDPSPLAVSSLGKKEETGSPIAHQISDIAPLLSELYKGDQDDTGTLGHSSRKGSKSMSRPNSHGNLQHLGRRASSVDPEEEAAAARRDRNALAADVAKVTAQSDREARIQKARQQRSSLDEKEKTQSSVGVADETNNPELIVIPNHVLRMQSFTEVGQREGEQQDVAAEITRGLLKHMSIDEVDALAAVNAADKEKPVLRRLTEEESYSGSKSAGFGSALEDAEQHVTRHASITSS